MLEVGLPLAEQPEPLRGRPDVVRADALPQLVLQLGDLVQPRDDHRLELTPRGLQKGVIMLRLSFEFEFGKKRHVLG